MSDSVFWGYFKPFIIGSLSGGTASAVIQPLDTIKVVIQNKREMAGKTQVNLSPFHVGREIVSNNGVAGIPLPIQDSTRDSTRPSSDSSSTAASASDCSRC